MKITVLDPPHLVHLEKLNKQQSFTFSKLDSTHADEQKNELKELTIKLTIYHQTEQSTTKQRIVHFKSEMETNTKEIQGKIAPAHLQ